MSKKIDLTTLMNGKHYIHCEDLVEEKKLTTIFNNEGYNWASGTSYLYKSYVNDISRGPICYRLKEGTWDKPIYLDSSEYISAEDFIENYKATELIIENPLVIGDLLFNKKYPYEIVVIVTENQLPFFRSLLEEEFVGTIIRTNGEMSIQSGTWIRSNWELIEDMEVSLKLKNI